MMSPEDETNETSDLPDQLHQRGVLQAKQQQVINSEKGIDATSDLGVNHTPLYVANVKPMSLRAPIPTLKPKVAIGNHHIEHATLTETCSKH